MFESKEKLRKTLIEALELAGDAAMKTDKGIYIKTSKAESEAFEAKTECVKLLR